MAAGVKVVARAAHWVVLALVLAMVCLLAKAQGDVVDVAGGGVVNEKSAGRSTYGPVDARAPEPESEYDYDEDVEVEMELATARGPGGLRQRRERGRGGGQFQFRAVL